MRTLLDLQSRALCEGCVTMVLRAITALTQEARESMNRLAEPRSVAVAVLKGTNLSLKINQFRH
jgi:hypothetical protein